MTEQAWMRPLGSTRHLVSGLTFGTSPLPEAGAHHLVEVVLDSDIRSIDTSNAYSGGRSETVIGDVIAARGGLPSDRVVISKTDPDNDDYSGDRVRRSVDESLQRLNLDRLPLLHLHDPDHFDFGYMTGPGGAVQALVDLRDEGVVDSIGVAGGKVTEIERYLELGVFDALLVHNRLTLLDHSGEGLVDTAVSQGMAVFNAAVFGGGILAAPRAGITKYAYRPARAELLAAVAAMADIADEYHVELATIALQASLRDPRVTSTVIGFGKPQRVESTLAAARLPIPDEAFERISALMLPGDLWVDW